LRKSVATQMIRARPTMPTTVKTRPEATLFCKKDELLGFGLSPGPGIALGVDGTVTVAVCTGTDVLVVSDEVLVVDATGADEVLESVLLDDDEVVEDVPLPLADVEVCVEEEVVLRVVLVCDGGSGITGLRMPSWRAWKGWAPIKAA